MSDGEQLPPFTSRAKAALGPGPEAGVYSLYSLVAHAQLSGLRRGYRLGTSIEAPGAEQIGCDNARVSFRFNPEQTRVADLIAAITSRYPVTDLSIVEPDLEGVIKQIRSMASESNTPLVLTRDDERGAAG